MRYLRDKGLLLLQQGYNIVPIAPGHKFPTIDDFLQPANPNRLNKWLSNGHARDGVGTTTRNTPCVDIDCLDRDCARHMQAFTFELVGETITKIGQPPKRGLIYQSTKPFRKQLSRWYIDGQGRKAQIEILGDGQQTVLYHIHPDTKKPYFYPGRNTPLILRASELPIFTAEHGQTIIEEFHRYADEHGWQIRTREPTRNQVSVLPPTELDDLDIDSDQLDMSDDELRQRVQAIPNNEQFDARDDWFKIGAAIWHQTHGSEEGRVIFLEWSEQHPSHKQALFDKFWRSLGKNDETRRPITARFIIQLTPEYTDQKNAKNVAQLTSEFEFAKNTEELNQICKKARKLNLNALHFATLVSSLRTQAKRITGQLLPTADAKRMLAQEITEETKPEWCENWCFLTEIKRFFNTNTKELYDPQTFDITFVNKVPSSSMMSAHTYAMTQGQIPTYTNALYMPSEDETFNINDRLYANTYRPASVPPIPKQLTEIQHQHVDIVRAHFAHLFPDDRERQLFISWHAYIVQTRQRPNWAVVMQGVEGDGKSVIGDMMAAVLGGENCRVLQAKTLESPFNAWAIGQLYTLIEEIRIVGHNRYDILDAVKPLITNATISIHPKNLNPYDAPNTTAYAAATNYTNALPLTDNDRRYFILMSQWQDADKLNEFVKNNPDYYKNLYSAIHSSPGAIRKWLLRYKLHPEFDPKGRAPHSEGREYMALMNRSELSIDIIDTIKEAGRPDVNPDLIIVSSLMEMLSDDFGELYSGQTIKIILSDAGFKYLGRIDIGGKRESVWAKNPPKYSKKPGYKQKWVRNALRSRPLDI